MFVRIITFSLLWLAKSSEILQNVKCAQAWCIYKISCKFVKNTPALSGRFYLACPLLTSCHIGSLMIKEAK